MKLDVVKITEDVDFEIIDRVYKESLRLKTVHGTVFLVKGLIEGDQNELMILGIVDGEEFAQVAFYKEFYELERSDDLSIR